VESYDKSSDSIISRNSPEVPPESDNKSINQVLTLKPPPGKTFKSRPTIKVSNNRLNTVIKASFESSPNVVAPSTPSMKIVKTKNEGRRGASKGPHLK
jgi:hypothetical protein